MRTFVMGDIHGCAKGLVQCLERSRFDKEKDTLIQLGDICDGWTEVHQCVEILLSIKNLISIRGNHDAWFNHWLLFGVHPVHWMYGGEGTLASYIDASKQDYRPVMYKGGWKSGLNPSEVDPRHLTFFNSQNNYYVDDQNRIFVHGGFDREISIKNQDSNEFFWDRHLVMTSMSCVNGQKLKTADGFVEIYVGHTSTMNWGKNIPIVRGGVHNLDTGAGFDGRLTIMEVETGEYCQSDLVTKLYPDEKGRGELKKQF
jgi:serine/threonine protein phosphatase 1